MIIVVIEFGAQKRTRTSTSVRILAPEASASAIPPSGQRTSCTLQRGYLIVKFSLSKDGTLLGGYKLHGKRIYTVTRVLVREVFSGEDVTQVPITICTTDFRTTAVSIRNFLHCSRDLLIKAWPATTGVKLRVRRVELGVAAAACIRAFPKLAVVRTRKRRLRTSVFDDVLFLRR